MWISKKEWRALEEKVSDLEKKTEDLTQRIKVAERFYLPINRFQHGKARREVKVFSPKDHNHTVAGYRHILY